MAFLYPAPLPILPYFVTGLSGGPLCSVRVAQYSPGTLAHFDSGTVAQFAPEYALGHASVAFTMDCYSHIIKGMQEDAMKLLDEMLPAAVSRKFNDNLTTITDIMLSTN